MPAFAEDSFDPLELLKDTLDTADILNQEMLKVTELSEAEQNRVGQQLLPAALAKRKLLPDSDSRLRHILASMHPFLKHQHLAYEVLLAQDDTVNAFAIIGGKVVFYTGLMRYLRTDAELAFVLGHELGHQDLLHCAHQYQYAVQANRINPLLQKPVQLMYSLYALPFSKQQEYAADAYGVWLMEKAGFSRQGAINVLNQFDRLEKPSASHDRLDDFFSSHATPADRIKAIMVLPSTH